MVPDPLSPIAPARVRALLLPLGRVKRSRFLTFVDRLRQEDVIRLGDVSPDGRPNRTMFSPLAFPTGRLLYDLSTSLPPPSQLALSPFELYREPVLVIGIADCTEIGQSRGFDGDDLEEEEAAARKERDIQYLSKELDSVREQFPKALVHQLLLFDYTKDADSALLPDGAVGVQPPEMSRTTTIKTIMCDLSSLLLAEMTTFAKSLQALYTIDSPSSSQNAVTTNGYSAWASDPSAGLMRRNSQVSTQSQVSRSSSPGGSIDRSHHPLSMPVHLSSSSPAYSGLVAGARTGSPPSGRQTPPATSFDQIPGVTTGTPLSNTVSRSSAGTAHRDSSVDRVSVQGFGSGSLSERARNKGKGRVGVVVGSLYLHAGRWGDAIREFVESATIARANSDHLWHAKALENILVGLLMFAWVGMDFQIPQICYPSTEKTASKSPQHTPSNSTTDIQAVTTANRLISLQNLTTLIPDLLNTILNLYTRAANFTGESLPQLPFSEAVIRFSKLMSAVHLSNGRLDDDTLAHIVLNTPYSSKPKLCTPRVLISPTRTEIITMLFRAYPPSSGFGLSVIDRTLILSGICSVLSSLGFHRKKAFIMRELINVLIPGLVQARKLGAAEMGVHPAAGLAALNAASGGAGGAGALDLGAGDVEIGVRELLEVLGNAYGVVGISLRRPGTKHNEDNDRGIVGKLADTETVHDDSNEAVIARIQSNAAVRSCGSLGLKMIVLRSSINLCEALPDFQGVLRFTTELLRTAGSGVAPSPNSSEAITSLSREEQVRLATNISRTMSAAAKLGLKGIEAEYWDDFLVRGVEVIEPPSWKAPIPHAKSELVAAGAIVEEKEKSPFIYNPFLRKPDPAAAEKLLLAGEPAEFRVTLQNPFDFDVEIERFFLESEGVEFESERNTVVVGPYRTHTLSVTGVAKVAGSLSITGCTVKVRGCRERRFPIFMVPWTPERQVKIKKIGLAAAAYPAERPLSTVSASKVKALTPKGPIASILDLNVIREQPVVVVKSTSLPQSALMLLEGQTTAFQITLQNLSSTTAVDLLLFSFQDSTTAPLQAAMNNKDMSPSELYELELLFSRKQAFRWLRKIEDDEIVIPPGQTATFHIEVLGKPGLTSGLVQVDYAHVGVPRRDVAEKFYTRQVLLPVTVTVNASVELTRVDILPLASDFGWVRQEHQEFGDRDLKKDNRSRRKSESRSEEPGEQKVETIREHLGLKTDARDHCLLLLDVRNSWPRPLKVTLEVGEPDSHSTEASPVIWSNAHTTEEHLQPGHTSRLVLPLHRILVQSPHAPIPTLNPANQRQFVVSASKIAPDVERSTREAFWYREELLKLIRGVWEEEETGKQGAVELRGIRLSPRMIDVVKVEDLGIEMLIKEDPDQRVVRQVGPSRFEVPKDEFLTLTTRLHNRSRQPIYPMLRLQPSLRNQPHNIALDLSKRFAYNGLLQRPLPVLRPGQVMEDTMTVCALCRGEFEIGASVEEIRIWQPATDEKQDEGGLDRIKEDTGGFLMADTVLGEKQRRIWMGRETCVIIAQDRIDDD